MSKDVEAIRGSASSKEIRSKRIRRLVRRMLIGVALPTLLGIIYYGFWAAPQYDSVSLVSVQSAKDGKVVTAKRDAQAVKEYVLSRAVLRELNDNHGWQPHYGGDQGDLWSRLPSDAGEDTRYQYYLDKVSVEYLDESGSLELRVRAFSSEAAQTFSKAILSSAEKMLASQFEALRIDTVLSAEEQAKDARSALAAADQAMSKISNGSSADAPEKSVRSEFDAAQFQVELARKRLDAKLAALDEAQLRAVQGKLRLVTISAPSQPSEAAHPRRLWGIVTVFVLSLVGMAVFSMLGAAVREHARF